MRCVSDRLCIRRRRSISGLLLFVAFITFSCGVLPRVESQDFGDEFVREVLEEDQRHYDSQEADEPVMTAPSRNDTQFSEETEEERRERERLERIAFEREAAFEAELAKMSEEKRKAAQRQKKRDAQIVRRTLRAAKREDHYAVLGLRNLEVTVPAKVFSIMGQNLTIPGFSMFHISAKDIRKAYRNMALTVHPDKNRDGRAEEAFIAVENSASILSDPKTRQEYDNVVRAIYKARRKMVIETAKEASVNAVRFLATVKKLLGPFAFPVMVIGTLIA